MSGKLLIVDDHKAIRHTLSRYFERRSLDVLTTASGTEAVEICRTSLIDVVLLDLRLPDLDGIEVLEQIKADSPTTAVIIITAHGDVETAVRAMQMRADNFVLKPVDLDVLDALVSKVVEQRTTSEVHHLKQRLGRLTGTAHSTKLRFPSEVMATVRLLADNPATSALILGETGSGKGVAARLVHELSPRSGQLVEINCAGLSSELLESELFGHQKGAFTDAKTSKPGLLELAHRGSLLLDEIGELSPAVQARLLNVLEDRSFRRLGGTRSIDVDIRILAATNRDLDDAVRTGRFRPDLFFRLNVMPVTLPPLRERSDDILALAHDFLRNFSSRAGKGIHGLAEPSKQLLIGYGWPGNIRELRNIIERAVLLCEDEQIQPQHLPDTIRTAKPEVPLAAGGDLSLAAAEKHHIGRVLALYNDNRTRAARALGINRSTLQQKIAKYGL